MNWKTHVLSTMGTKKVSSILKTIIVVEIFILVSIFLYELDWIDVKAFRTSVVIEVMVGVLGYIFRKKSKNKDVELFNKREDKHPLKELPERLLKLYKPYYKELINIQKKLPANRKIDNIDELELAFIEIDSGTIHKLDYDINQCRIQFLGAPNENTLTNFLDAVKSKITELENKIKKI